MGASKRSLRVISSKLFPAYMCVQVGGGNLTAACCTFHNRTIVLTDTYYRVYIAHYIYPSLVQLTKPKQPHKVWAVNCLTVRVVTHLAIHRIYSTCPR